MPFTDILAYEPIYIGLGASILLNVWLFTQNIRIRFSSSQETSSIVSEKRGLFLLLMVSLAINLVLFLKVLNG